MKLQSGCAKARRTHPPKFVVRSSGETWVYIFLLEVWNDPWKINSAPIFSVIEKVTWEFTGQLFRNLELAMRKVSNPERILPCIASWIGTTEL